MSPIKTITMIETIAVTFVDVMFYSECYFDSFEQNLHDLIAKSRRLLIPF